MKTPQFIRRFWRSSVWRSVRNIGFVFANLLLITGVAMMLPIVCSLIYGQEGDLIPLLISAGISVLVGLPLRLICRDVENLKLREAFLITSFGWVVISALSAIPFVLHGSIPSFTDAFLEMMSGYTTTGATILNDIEAVPHGLLLWRSETHFLGGMGFITFAVLLLPHGMGGARLFKAESSPGQVITGERFIARNRDAVNILWIIYLLLNLLQIILYMFGGMSLFDATCHAFGTVSTSGYSTYNASMGHFNSAYFDWITIIFMFLGGITFGLFYSAYRKDWNSILINTELRWYCWIVGLFSLGVSIVIWQAGFYDGLDALRHGTFQTVSLLTTTGFTTADYEQWPQLAQMLLLTISFVGGCAGSTSSGIKVIHYVLIWKFMVAAIKQLFFQPLAVVAVRVNEQRVPQSIITLALCYFIVNIFLIFVGGAFMTAVDPVDFSSGISAVIAALMNIGPGFGAVGPSHNFSEFSDIAKWFLSFNMLVGRLEMFSALILFYPSFWRE